MRICEPDSLKVTSWNSSWLKSWSHKSRCHSLLNNSWLLDNSWLISNLRRPLSISNRSSSHLNRRQGLHLNWSLNLLVLSCHRCSNVMVWWLNLHWLCWLINYFLFASWGWRWLLFHWNLANVLLLLHLYSWYSDLRQRYGCDVLRFALDNLGWDDFSLSLFNSDIAGHNLWTSVRLLHSSVAHNGNDLLLRDVLSVGVLVNLGDLFLLDLHLVIVSHFHLSRNFLILHFFLVLGFHSRQRNVLLSHFSLYHIQRNTRKRTTNLLLSHSSRKTWKGLSLHLGIDDLLLGHLLVDLLLGVGACDDLWVLFFWFGGIRWAGWTLFLR